MSATRSLRPWQQACLQRYRLRLRHPLLLGDTPIYYREGLYLHLGFDDGRHGLGEIAPLPHFSRESLDQAQLQISAYLQGQCEQSLFPSVAFGLSCALRGQSDTAAIAADYPLITQLEHLSAEQLSLLSRSPIAKCKVARQPAEQELIFLSEILQRFPKIKLRLDANQGWSWQDASYVLKNLPRQRIDYIEEPLSQPELSSELAQHLGMNIALDESVQAPDYQFNVFPGLSTLVLKPSLIGGISRIERLVSQAAKAGIDSVLSSAYESEVGIAWLSQLAKQLTPQQAPGIDTLNIFASEQAETLWQQRFC